MRAEISLDDCTVTRSNFPESVTRRGLDKGRHASFPRVALAARAKMHGITMHILRASEVYV